MEFIKFFSLQREKSLDFYASYSALYVEFFQDLDLNKLAESTAQTAIRMATAGYINGADIPVDGGRVGT